MVQPSDAAPSAMLNILSPRPATRYFLFFFLHRFCAYDVDAEWSAEGDRVYVTKLLTDKALEEADDSDKNIPLEIAGMAEFSGKGGWIHLVFPSRPRGAIFVWGLF